MSEKCKRQMFPYKHVELIKINKTPVKFVAREKADQPRRCWFKSDICTADSKLI